MDDFAYAGRRLLRSPGFSATAIAILVLGIGVNSTAFSFVNALLFQPPPFADPEAVVDVLQDSDDGRPNSTSYPAYLDIVETDGVFSSVAAFSTDRGFLDQDGVMAPVMIEYATSSYMDVVGLSPAMGRWFDRGEDDPSGPPAVVVSHKTWQDRMGADPGIVGTTVRIGGATVEIVGVGPREFNGGTGPVAIDFWLSISAMAPTGGRAASLTRRADHPFTVRARLAPTVGLPQAQAAMDGLADYLGATYPEINDGRRISVLPVVGNGLPPDAYGELIPGATLAMIVVGLVLLIGTLNLANLLLVRTTARAHEIAVRLALGAGRSRVIRVVVTEALLLAALGSAGALGLTAWIVSLVGNGVLEIAGGTRFDVRLDATVLLFTLGVSLVAGLVFGLVPALRVTSRDLSVSLRDEVRVKIGAGRRFGLTGILVAGQVTVSLVLLAVAGVFLQSLFAARSADPGFLTQNTAYVQFSAQPIVGGVPDIVDVVRRIEEQVEMSPAVQSAAFSIQLPAAQFGTSTLLLGAGLGSVDEPVEVPWNSITSDYFEVLGISLLHGRVFGPGDAEDSPAVTIVSEALARAYWGRPDVVGEALHHEGFPDEPVEIVGVVADVPVRALGERPTPSFYRPLPQWASGRGNVVFQFTGPAQQAVAAASTALQAVDPRILIFRGSPLADHLGETLGQRRLVGGMLSLLGSLALALALLGIYGVVSFAVTRRRHEVGIRLALGAARSSVVGLFLRDVAAVVLTGALVGLAVAIPVGRLVGETFTGTSPSSFLMIAAAGVLVSTAMFATMIPALRAAKTDPTGTLHSD